MILNEQCSQSRLLCVIIKPLYVTYLSIRFYDKNS